MGNCFSSKPEKSPQKQLHVILPISNPINFKRRQLLFNQALQRLLKAKNSLRGEEIQLEIVVVELKYEAHESPMSFDVESTHITMSASTNMQNVLWSKENLINLAIERLLTSTSAKYVAWVDADIEFESSKWVEDTVCALDDLAARGGGFAQMFSQAHLLGPTDQVMQTVKGFAAQNLSGRNFEDHENSHPEYWHPGFAWAATADTLRAFLHRSELGDNGHTASGALIERTIGGADRHMAMAFIGRAAETFPAAISQDYKDMVTTWQNAARGKGVGCVPGTIRHYFHGSLANRKYMERWDVLLRSNFLPMSHMVRRQDGLLIWTAAAPEQLRTETLAYFRERDEDSLDFNANTMAALPVPGMARAAAGGGSGGGGCHGTASGGHAGRYIVGGGYNTSSHRSDGGRGRPRGREGVDGDFGDCGDSDGYDRYDGNGNRDGGVGGDGWDGTGRNTGGGGGGDGGSNSIPPGYNY